MKENHVFVLDSDQNVPFLQHLSQNFKNVHLCH